MSHSLRSLLLKSSLICAPLLLGALAPRGESADPVVVSTAHHALAAPDGKLPFRLSSDCATCHSNLPTNEVMQDEAGNGIAPYDLWQATMMANAARDPFWRAMVEAEGLFRPELRGAIEEKCMRCHAPMAKDDSGDAPYLDLLDEFEDRASLARDGVSCTVCHTMKPDGLGTEESFDGHFVTNREGLAYGPHDVKVTGPMTFHVGLKPVQGTHINEQSGLCGSCHTQHTDVFDDEGKPTGEHFDEQTIYLEWLNSMFTTEDDERGTRGRSCQSCHVPTRSEAGKPIEQFIARSPMGAPFRGQEKYQPVGRHIFVGGNTVIPQMLRDNGDDFWVTAPPEAFDRTIEAARDQLENRTASLQVDGAKIERTTTGGVLRAEVTVRNLTGHKLPTGFPSRRMWLRVLAKDADGEVVFRSGDFDPRGRLIDKAGVLHSGESVGGPQHPHRDVVDGTGEPVVWQAVMSSPSGDPTYRLTAAGKWWKDDRLLPYGWTEDGPYAERTAARGVDGDEDFVAGQDAVSIAVPLPSGVTVASLEVSLHYQPIAPRFAEELFAIAPKGVKAPNVKTFKKLWAEADTKPEQLARKVIAIQ